MSEQQGDYKLGDGNATPKRQKIWNKSNGRCWYCGATASQVDHINPVILGGGSGIENLVPVCKWCNKSKRGLPLEVWRKKVSLKHGLSFTDEQRAFWGNRIPEDAQHLFWFEMEGLKP